MKYWASSRAATASSMGLCPFFSSVCICLLGHKCKIKLSVKLGERDTQAEGETGNLLQHCLGQDLELKPLSKVSPVQQ